MLKSNGHGKNAAPDDEVRHARFPLPIPPPQEGEGEYESLREFHVNGFSLVELMVAMAIGMFLMLGISVFFMASARAGMDNIKSTRVNNILRAAVELMGREIARAGYSHDALLNVGPGYSNPFAPVVAAQYKVAGDCIVFGYDANANGVLDASEYRGFRLNGSTIEMKVSGAAWNCNEGVWQILTPGLVSIDALQFNLTSYNTPIGTRNAVDRRVAILLSGSSSVDKTVRQDFNETLNIRNDVIL